MQAMIVQWGRTTQRVVPLSRLGESSDEGGRCSVNWACPFVFQKRGLQISC
jgi:hypothetical protein